MKQRVGKPNGDVVHIVDAEGCGAHFLLEPRRRRRSGLIRISVRAVALAVVGDVDAKTKLCESGVRAADETRRQVQLTVRR